MPEKRHERVRRRKNILVEGADPPPPLKTFADMKFPRGILNGLGEKKIEKPSPIQMQGIPAILYGRDLIGIAYTGSGKTLAFCLPVTEYLRSKNLLGQRKIQAIMLCPTRELAIQVSDTPCALAYR